MNNFPDSVFRAFPNDFFWTTLGQRNFRRRFLLIQKSFAKLLDEVIDEIGAR
jgi:hypothetical protein